MGMNCRAIVRESRVAYKVTRTLGSFLCSHKSHPSTCHGQLGHAAVATPSLWQWMQIICRSENSPPDKVQSIHILNLHPRQVSPGCWLASPSLLLHVPTRERRRLFLQIYIYIYIFKKCQIIAPPAETSFNLLFWEHTREQIAFPDRLCCPCHALNYDANGAVRGEAALWQNIKSTDWARGRHGFTASQTTFVPSTGLYAHLHFSHLLPSLTFTLHLLTYFAEACVQTKIFPHFPLCLSPAWHPRICLWSQHKAWLCSKCTHSGGSAWEVQSAHTDLCEACVVGKRQIWKCNDCFFFVRSYSCASTNMLLAFEVLQLAFPCSWSQAI